MKISAGFLLRGTLWTVGAFGLGTVLRVVTNVVLARLLALNHVDRIQRFEFRARSPLYVNRPIHFMGKPTGDRIGLRAIGSSGMLAMEATAWLTGSRADSP